jgi:hypothetical protein
VTVLADKPTIIETIRNPDLFDSLFKTQSTWVAWFVWLKAVFGLEMAPSGLEVNWAARGRPDTVSLVEIFMLPSSR